MKTTERIKTNKLFKVNGTVFKTKKSAELRAKKLGTEVEIIENTFKM